MDHLVNEGSYPAETRKQIQALGDYAVDVANRWMLGWPGRVKGLLRNGEYLELLMAQVEEEMAVLTGPDAPTHLAWHEIVQLYGLSLEAPTPTDSRDVLRMQRAEEARRLHDPTAEEREQDRLEGEEAARLFPKEEPSNG